MFNEVVKLEQEPIIVMYELDLQYLGLGIFRFSPTSVDGVAVKFNGYIYLPAAIEVTGFAWDGQGTIPRPQMTLSTPDLSFLNTIVSFDDIVGAGFKRIKTFRKYLDDGSAAHTGMSFPAEEYVVEKKSNQSRHTVVFELSAHMDQQGLMIPRKLILRDSCVHTYRNWTGAGWNYRNVTCPYAAPRMYKTNGESTTDQYKDACGKRISDCKLRFGNNAVLPRLAFPGVGRY